MKKFRFTLGLILGLLIINNSVYANNIPQIVKKEEVRLKNYVDKQSRANGSDYKYRIENESFFLADMNNDGNKDLIITYYSCEQQNCHKTTSSRYISLYLSDKKGNYKYLTTTEVDGYEAQIYASKGKISVRAKDYSYNDPSCCPSLDVTYSYKLGKDLDGHIKLLKSSF